MEEKSVYSTTEDHVPRFITPQRKWLMIGKAFVEWEEAVVAAKATETLARSMVDDAARAAHAKRQELLDLLDQLDLDHLLLSINGHK